MADMRQYYCKANGCILKMETKLMAKNPTAELSDLSELHEYWFDGVSQCDGCPRRDCDKVTRPLYGCGEVPADIAIVAQAPGGDSISDVTGSKIGNGRRTWKNYSESGHSGATAANRDKFEIIDIESIGNYEKDIAPVVDAFAEVYQNQLEQSCSVYYTQHTKCNDIHADWFDPNNDEGQSRCAEYLTPELALVDPDIVLVMGGKPDSHLQRALKDVGVNEDLPSRVTDTVFADGSDATKVRTYESTSLDTTILPSFHYGYWGMRSMKQYTSIDKDEYYWRLLAEAAVAHLD